MSKQFKLKNFPYCFKFVCNFSGMKMMQAEDKIAEIQLNLLGIDMYKFISFLYKPSVSVRYHRESELARWLNICS